jgi:formylglycine-generating enzyme
MLHLSLARYDWGMMRIARLSWNAMAFLGLMFALIFIREFQRNGGTGVTLVQSSLSGDLADGAAWTEVNVGAELNQLSLDELNQGTIGKAMQIKLPRLELIRFGYCPPGGFEMGSPESEAERRHDEDQVTVEITRGFWMGQYEVTQGQWIAVMRSNPSYFKGDELPVTEVSWDEAQAFVGRLNQMVPLPGKWQFVLPTEAQWEYACRAGTKTVFHFGDTLNGSEANCDPDLPYGTSIRGRYLGQPSVVGSYPPNAWGLYDMHGNVGEWCADWYGEHLPGGTDPLGPSSGYYRTNRGGSWAWIAKNCRAANRRSFNEQEDQGLDLGFRVAVVPTG